MNALATAPAPREIALLKAVGLDRLAPEQRELALHIAERYGLDLMLKHLVMIEGRPYITRDGLLHVAHRHGQLDGIETTEPEIVGDYWRSTCSVFRKDMSHPFTYTGRYPTKGGNTKFAPEMAVKVGEVMSLRRAFDVAAPVLEERWDVEVPEPPAPKPTLAERVQAKAAEVIEEGPKPLTKQQFVRVLDEYQITSAYAKSVREIMFPDAAHELTDDERGALLAELTKDLAPTEPLFAE